MAYLSSGTPQQRCATRCAGCFHLTELLALASGGQHGDTSPVRAIILSAGQGTRLGTMTAQRPKCLLPIAGASILEWQLRALNKAGVPEAVVVTGFGAEVVEFEVRRLQPSLTLRASTRFNPFYGVADNLGSCFVARDLLNGPCLLLNGDTLVEAAIVRRVLEAGAAPVAVTVDRKDTYDADDMKVQLDGNHVLAIGKTLPPERTNAESIGLLRFSSEGADAFANGVEFALRHPEGLRRWYLTVVDRLAGQGMVRANSISGLGWSEVDFPTDVARAELLARHWQRAPERTVPG